MYTNSGILITWLIKGRLGLEPCDLIEIHRDFNKQCLEWHGQSTTIFSIFYQLKYGRFFLDRRACWRE